MGAFVWFCSDCNDGPIASWHSVCVTCSHKKCGFCRDEEFDDRHYKRPTTYAGGSEDFTSEANADKVGYESNLKEGSAEHNEDDRDVALGRVSDSAPVLHSQGMYLGTSTVDDEDNMSTTSTTLGSVFSTDTLATSITAFSKESGFSIEEIQTATRVFVSIVRDDELLAPLYESARNDIRIGPNRLRRHIRGALKSFAEHLKEEANDHLEFLACRLVNAKARHAARCVASGEDMSHSSHASGIHYGQASKELDDSSEEETTERTVDDANMGDLRALRIFLTESEAYATLQEDIHAFCLKYSTTPQNTPSADKPNILHVPESNIGNTWHSWQTDTEELAHSLLLGFDQLLGLKAAMFLVLDLVFLLTDNVFIATGWLEPPLTAGWTRIRSQSSSGNRFFDDFIEIRKDGIAELVQEMRRSLLDVKITAISNRPGFAVQQYTNRASGWVRNISSIFSAAFSWHNKRPPSLILQYNSGTIPAVIHTGSPQHPPVTLHLMSCIHRGREHTVLLQKELGSIGTDQALFQFLKLQISLHRNRLRRAFSCRSVQGVSLTKLWLCVGGIVELRPHPHCGITEPSRGRSPVPNSSSFQLQTPYLCECLPPSTKLEPSINPEYRCKLPDPPGHWPPVGPATLLRMLKKPDMIDPTQTWIYNLVPKRLMGELSGGFDQPNEGWGFYFQEGWDFDLIITISFVVFILGSLLFGVCWSVLEHDIQGAFGVSAYMVTACGLFVAFVVSKTG